MRDRLLDRASKDIDIATSAHPDEVERLFRRTIAVGKQFGVIVVLIDRDAFEVATFRSDGAYTDGRRPDAVVFSTAREDVERRDFTINGLLFDPLTEEIIDHVGGRDDLAAGIVRTIGEPQARFTEDRLRLLRAVRFAARLGFTIHPETRDAIHELAERAADPSPERVREEIHRMLTEGGAARAFDLLVDLELLDVVLPEVAAKSNVELSARLLTSASSKVATNASARTRRLLDAMPDDVDPDIAWAVLLEDQTMGTPVERARRAEAVLRRLRASNDRMAGVRRLVLSRDRALFATRVSCARRRLVSALPDVETVTAYSSLEAREADVDHTTDAVEPRGFELANQAKRPTNAGPLPPPLLRGEDLMALGVPKGRRLGQIMRRLRFMQLDDRFEDADAARDEVRRREATRPG